MLVFAGFVPATPLLLPSVAGDRIHDVRRTLDAVSVLRDHLTVTRPTELIVIAGGAGHSDAISVEVADPYTTSLAAVGDLGHNEIYHPSFPLIDRLQRTARRADLDFTLNTEASLNLSTTVALEILLGRRRLPIIPILTSGHDLKMHFRFGELLREIVSHSNRRVALLATGNLGHTSSNPAGDKLNAMVHDVVSTKNTSGLLQIPDDLRDNARETCLPELAVLFGALSDVPASVNILSQEEAFNLGLMVADFTLPL